jgi:SEC-C motif-containing protein
MNENDLSIYTPSELILARSEAFSRGDFGCIFDTYHSESNFRHQFVERTEYLEFGASSLGQDYQITSCQVLQFQEKDDEAQVIFLMEMNVHGAVQCFAELAWLRQENGAWRYHRGLKISNEELPKSPQTISFADFAKLDQSTIF